MPDGTLPPRTPQSVFIPERLGPAAGFTGKALTVAPGQRRYRAVALTDLASLPEAAPSAGSAGAAAEAVAVALGIPDRAERQENPTARDTVPAPGSTAGPGAAEAPGLELLEDARSRGRAEGLAEGLTQGRAAAQAELAVVREDLSAAARALGRALAALSRPAAVAVDGLAARLEATIMRLAAQRAGQAIDAAPAPFAARVARLAARVASHQGAVRVHLHPDDLAAIAPLVAAGLPDLADLATARLVPDAALARGDADLRAPGIRLADLWDVEETPA